MTLGEGVRLTGLLASLSLATDLGTGQPLGHGLRVSLLAVWLGREMGLGDERTRSVQRVSLLRFLGCTADAPETARMAGGDDVAFNATAAPVFNGSRAESLGMLIRSVGAGQPMLSKVGRLLEVLTDSGEPSTGLAAHCEVAAMLAGRLGLDQRVTTALLSAYERWNGNGYPRGLEQDAVPIEIRLATVARDVDVLFAEGLDVEATLKQRRGNAYDPEVVDAFLRLGSPHPEADWQAVLDLEPEPIDFVKDVDSALEVMADFTDLKSTWARGHSRAVASVAKASGEEMGLAPHDVERLKRAALAHDVGRVGVPAGIWEKPTSLSTAEWERVRLYPYHTQRVLSRCRELAPMAHLASSQQERLDGSGYHRQLTSDDITAPGRVLACSDMLVALLSPRPYRDAHDLPSAAELMRNEARSGRLDPYAVECTIGAAGGSTRRVARLNPDGLSDREIEVLRHISRGLTNKDTAEKLFISAKTVGRHVENIYRKIGVSTRAGAAVYAMEANLLD